MLFAAKRVVVVFLWLVAIGLLFILGSKRAGAVPGPCNVCQCRNVQIYNTYDSNGLSGHSFFFKKKADGTYVLSTHAIASCQTSNKCDDPVPTSTTDKVVPVISAASAICDYSLPPPGQTISVEADGNEPDPPNDDKGAITRYVCSPP